MRVVLDTNILVSALLVQLASISTRNNSVNTSGVFEG